MSLNCVRGLNHKTHCDSYSYTHPDISRMTTADIIDTFWNEFKSFQQCTHPFAEPSRWATVDLSGRRISSL